MRYTRKRTHWPKGTWMRLIGEHRLRRQIETAGYSYGRLADEVGVSKGFISHLTAGRKKTCSPQVAEKISEKLGVDIELLFMPSVSSDAGQVIPQQQKRKAAV